jgi:hypothetical protein
MENAKVYNQFGIATGMYVNMIEALSSIANVVSDPINPQQLTAGAIVNDIYSSNYKSGSAGWKLFYNGDFEGNAGTFRGALTVGSNAFHVDILGNMWWGNYATYAACVAAGGTYISSSGAAKFTSITISGYIAVGGAASDVNSNLTTISGTKLTTGTVTADYVVASISISSPTITGGSISIGTGNTIFKADASGIYLGNATFGSAPFRVDMNGAVTASSLTLTNASVGAGSSYTGNTIAETYIGNLSCSKITTGDFIVGGTNQPGNIKIIESSSGGAGGTTSLLRWVSSGDVLRGKIWSDASGYMGMNAIGGKIYLYGNSIQLLLIDQTGTPMITVGLNGTPCGFKVEGTFNVGTPNSTTYKARFTDGCYFDSTSATAQEIWGGSNQMIYNSTSYHYFNINSSEKLKCSSQGTSISNGLLYIPILTGTEAAGYASQNGACYYNSDTNTFKMYGNGSWQTVKTF